MTIKRFAIERARTLVHRPKLITSATESCTSFASDLPFKMAKLLITVTFGAESPDMRESRSWDERELNATSVTTLLATL